MKPTIAILWFALTAVAQVPFLPAIPTNHIAITNRPAHVVAVTNIVLTWQYTDAWFEVDSSTDMINWYWKTNVPIQATHVVIPIIGPFEFYKVKTLLNTNTQ